MLSSHEKTIVHLDLDSFFVSVERLNNTDLIGKPLIVGGNSDRGVVASCSYETRAFGVRSAMSIKLAKRLCPHAIIVKPDMEEYSKKSREVTQIIEEDAPLFEKASIDEHYLDITGMDKFFGCWKWTQELRERIIHETGLPISFGLSVNKTVSKIATGEGKPLGQKQVLQSDVKPFLFPLPVKKIPGVGPKMQEKLRALGVNKIETIAKMPLTLVQQTLENGLTIWQKANGIDNSPVIPYSEAKSISEEETFEKDTTDKDFLCKILRQMIERVSFSLRQQIKLTGCVTVKVRYSDFETHTIQKRIAYTSFDHTIYEVAKEIFFKLYNRRVLVRLLGVKVSHLVTGEQQINMFEDSTELINLYQAIDKMKNRFGEKSVTRGFRL